MKTILFACVHNAGRSQMAMALFNQVADPLLARAVSAGTQPAAAVYPEVRVALGEIGVEVPAGAPRLLTPEIARQASLLITMGCGEACPVVPGLKREDWPLPDPKGQPLPRVREIRDALRIKVEELLRREGWSRRKT